MKKYTFLIFFLLVAMAGRANQVPPYGAWYTGNPDATKFTIKTAQDLADLAILVNNGTYFSGKTIELDASETNHAIDLSTFDPGDSKGWMPIGTSYSCPFKGVFDGQGDTIKGLWIDRDNNNIALFGAVGEGGSIKNLTVKDVTVVGKYYVGVLVGNNMGTIENCHVSGKVTGKEQYIGGLVGINSAAIKKSHADVEVTGTEARIGGLVGCHESGTISECYATGNVTGGNYVGGLVGENKNAIINCYATGNVTGKGQYIGGLTGLHGFDVSSITNCYVIGAVIDGSESQNRHPGGLVGEQLDGAGAIASSFFLNNQTSGQTLGIGNVPGSTDFGRTTDEMQDIKTFTDAGWNFIRIGEAAPIWFISSSINNGYPCLKALENTYTAGDPEPTPDPNPQPQPSSYTVTLTADEGIILLPGAGTHGATIGGSFTFYITLAPGFEGRTPQATVNGDPVQLTLRPNGTEWMYTIPRVYDDTRVAAFFSTTDNDNVAAPRLYSHSGQLYVETPQPTTLTVYSLSGQTLVARRLSEGLTTISLPRGNYVVKMNERVERITIK